MNVASYEDYLADLAQLSHSGGIVDVEQFDFAALEQEDVNA